MGIKDSTWFDGQGGFFVVKYEHTFEENKRQSLSRLRRQLPLHKGALGRVRTRQREAWVRRKTEKGAER